MLKESTIKDPFKYKVVFYNENGAQVSSKIFSESWQAVYEVEFSHAEAPYIRCEIVEVCAKCEDAVCSCSVIDGITGELIPKMRY